MGPCGHGNGGSASLEITLAFSLLQYIRPRSINRKGCTGVTFVHHKDRYVLAAFARLVGSSAMPC